MKLNNLQELKNKIEQFKKNIDPKYIAISANIPKIINHISTFDIRLSNIFQSVYVDYKIVQFLDNAFADNGNFFKDYYCAAVNNIEIAPVIIINIRLALQRLVGDISASHIDELITSSNEESN